MNVRSLRGGDGGIFLLGFLNCAWGTGTGTTSVVGRVGIGVRAGVRRSNVFATERGSAKESSLAVRNRSGLNTNVGRGRGRGGQLEPPGPDFPRSCDGSLLTGFFLGLRVWFLTS